MTNCTRGHLVSWLTCLQPMVSFISSGVKGVSGRAFVGRRGPVFAVLCLMVSGCASIKLGGGGDASAVGVARQSKPIIERAILDEAVNELADAPWPKPDPITLRMRVGRLFLAGDKDTQRRKNLDECTAEYVMQLVRHEDPVFVLGQDTAATLRKAAAVAEAGRQTSQAAKPLKSDVALLEDAISEIRLARAIVAASTKELENKGFSVGKRDAYFDALSQTMKDVSQTTDLVAARAFRGERIEVAETETIGVAEESALLSKLPQ